MVKNKANIFPFLLIVGFISLFIIGFWSLSSVLVPMCGLFMLALFKSIRQNKKRIFHLRRIDFLILLIFFIEIIIFLNSSYQANSIFFLYKTIVILLIYVVYHLVINSHNSQKIFFTTISIYGILLGIGTLFFFLTFQFNVTYEGFEDITNFRSLYHPFGSLSNDWTAILLLFLPFIGISFFAFSNHEYLKFVFGSGFFIVCFGIVLSFSRGAYLALFAFLLLLFFLFLYFKIIKAKRLLISATFIAVIFTLMVFTVSQPVQTTIQVSKTTSQVRSIEGRLSTWESSLSIINQHWWLGVGSGNFPLKYVKAKNVAEDTYFTGRVSNSILQLLIEKGITGLTVYSIVVLVIIWTFGRLLVNTKTTNNDKIKAIIMLSILFALAVKEATFSSLFEKDGVLLLVFMLIAISRVHSENVIAIQVRNENLFRAFGVVLCVAILTLCWNKNQHLKEINHIAIALDSIQSQKYHEGLFYIEKSIDLAQNNAHYHNIKALVLQRLADKQLKLSSGIIKPDRYNSEDIINLERIKNEYSISLKLNPEDDLAHHNLAWIYFELNEITETLFHLKQAIKIDPTIAIYQISLGLFSEYNGELEKAFMLYKTAIRNSPELLDSEFYNSLINRYPTKTKTILNDVEKDIRKALNKTDSPIYKARLARILIYNKQLEEAKQMLLDVVSVLPNLNRPWLNLAYLYRDENNEEKMLSSLKRATLLDPNDYLPHIKLAEYYYEKKQMHDALIYYTKTLKRYDLIRSANSVRSKSVYKSSGVPNNIVPNGLLQYTKPRILLDEICQNLAKIYESKGNRRLEKYFNSAKGENKVDVQSILETMRSGRSN